ncbi:hypothetical protein CEK00_09370 [Stenotrophomonas maltophilia]|uniref:Uncharacterized protein n=1 Tax=Stenotrophomonas maltophilia TaxID=40324 RepID=A0A270NI04_STEMA|nr:hypothetical protein [Stenotrophomonas maltophilia]PAM64639.1 hypothetical protein CEK00_21690 [Stenotrophomonas maltophilia]PAM71796.1 hypothetical protein CEK00_09370 [Stenotrophomonas maltophilia]
MRLLDQLVQQARHLLEEARIGQALLDDGLAHVVDGALGHRLGAAALGIELLRDGVVDAALDD